jgi:autotransporter-associated beta strand protein
MFGWGRWLRRRLDALRGIRKARERCSPRRPCLEPLEGRLAPAVLIWNGSLDSQWGTIQSGTSVLSNWTNGDGPSQGQDTGAVPMTGDDLVFPAGVPSTVLVNNTANLSVHSITFQGGGYAISGNALTVTGSITDQTTGSQNALGLPLVLPNTTAVVVSQGEALVLSGAISGAGGITKAGPGQLSFTGMGGNTYTGTTEVDEGSFLIQEAGGVVGPLVVGPADGSTTASAEFDVVGATAGTVPVTVNSTGTLNVNADDAIGSLSLNGGDVELLMPGGKGNPKPAVLTLNGDVTTTASSVTAVIEGVGTLSLGGATRTFTVADGAADPDLSVSAVIVGGASAGLTKAGPGRMVLAAADAYTGTTEADAGTLTLTASAAAAGPLVAGDSAGDTPASVQLEADGTTAATAAVTVNASGTLELGPAHLDTIGALTLNGGTALLDAGSTLTLGADVTASTGPGGLPSVITGGGTLSLGAAPRAFDVADGAFLHIGTPVDGPANATLTKDGAGTLALTANNTYLGATVLSDGVVGIAGNGALGDPSAGTTVQAGASLVLTGPVESEEPITLSGPGFQGGASLQSVAGAGFSDLLGPITLQADSTVETDAPLDIAGIISGPGGLTKTGGDSLRLSTGLPGNSYGGATHVNAGLLLLTAAEAVPGALVIGTGSGTPAQVLLTIGAATDPATAVTVNSDGLFAIGEDGSDAALAPFAGTSSSDTIASLTLNGGTVSIAGPQEGGGIPASVLTLGGDVTTGASANTAVIQGGGTLALGGATRAFTVAAGGANPDLAVSAAITDPGSGTGLMKAGKGRMVLSGNNAYNGTTDITAGELNVQSATALGTGPVVVEAGAALEVQAASSLLFANPLTLNGSGPAGAGALRSVSGSNAWTGDITLASTSAFGVDAGTLDLQDQMAGPGGLTKVGAGGLLLDNPSSGPAANSYGGTTEADQGLLVLAKAGAVPGDLAVGSGGGSGAQVLLTADTATDPTKSVTVNSDGLFAVGEDGGDAALAAFAGARSSDAVAALTLNGGTVSIAAAQGATPVSVFTLGGDVTTGASADPALIQGGGTFALGGATRTFTVADGSADPDLVVSAAITDGGAGTGLLKAGDGRMVLAATNGYTGTTEVAAGTLTLAAPSAVLGPLVVGDAAALAQIVVSNATAPGMPVTVNAGSELDVGAPGSPVQDTIGSLTLNGGTVNIAGAQGATPASVLTLGGDVTASASTSTAIIQGAGDLALGGVTRIFAVAGGAADPGLAIAAVLADGGAGAGLVKAGAGRLVLSGGNAYSGGTDVSAGALNVQSNTALGTGDATVEAGAALEVEAPGPAAVSIPNNVTLLGGGIGGTGALRNVSGNNFLRGDVTLAGDSTVGADAGSLDLQDRVTGPGGLTKTGAGSLILDAPASGPPANSYGGATDVDAGLLVLAKAGAVPGVLVVGTGSGAPGAVQVLLTADAATDPAATVTVNGDGLFAVGEDGSDPALASFVGAHSNDTVGSLTLDGGIVSIAGDQGATPASVLTLAGDVTTTASATTALIQGGGTLSLGGATRTFTVADGSADPDLIVSAAIADGGAGAGVSKAGAGRLVLAGTDAYFGITEVDAGTLTLDAPSAVIGPLVVGDAAGDTPAVVRITASKATDPRVDVTVNSSGTLDVGGTGSTVQDTVRSLRLNGGTVMIMGAQTVTQAGGQVTLPASVLTLGGNVTTTAAAAPATIGGNGTLALGGATRTFTVADGSADPDLVVSAVIADGGASAGLTKAGPGRMVLAGNSTYSNTTEVMAGELNVEASTALGSGPAVVETGAALEIQPVLAAGISPSLTLINPLTLNGSGVGGAGALRNISGSNSVTGSVTLGTDAVVAVDAGDLNLSGPVNGGGGLTKAGPAPLTLSGTTGDTYAGQTVVDAGTLLLGKDPGVVAIPNDLTIGTGGSGGSAPPPTVLLSNNEQIADGAGVTIASDGSLNVNGFSETIGSLAGAGQVILSNSSAPPAAGTLATGADNTSTTYAGLVSGSGGNLVKLGGGVFVLRGNNTYSGTTTVNGGTLLVDGSQPGSAAVVNAGGTLGGHGTVGPTTANAGGTVSPGDSPGILSVLGDATFNPGSVFFAEIDGPAVGTGYDQLSVAGQVTLNGPILRLSFGFSPLRGQDFVLIGNNGPGPIAGTFAGLPEDALLQHGAGFFDLSYAGGRGGDVDILSQSLGDVFVRALFADFGALSNRTTRAPLEGQVAAGTSRLMAARDFLNSPGRRLAEVNQFYATLGQPDDGLQGRYVAQLLAGVPSGEVVVHFLTSRSYHRHHRSNAAFVRAVFIGLLGHVPGRHSRLGHHSLAFYLRELNARTITRARLATELLSAPEVITAAVLQDYATLLGTRPAPAQLQAFTGQLLAGAIDPDGLSESLVSQDAYVDFFIARAAANRVPGVVLAEV